MARFVLTSSLSSGHTVLEVFRGVNVNSRDLPKIVVRLPRDVKNWLVKQAAENASSQTSEIVRAVRERMQRVPNETAARPSPKDV
jgi:type II secretory pathway component PulC